MFPESCDLRSNGPITRYPSWEAALAACKARSPSPPPKGESCDATPQGEGFDAPAAPNPQSEIQNPQSDAPSRRGRPKALDPHKQATICNLIAAGVSLRQASRFVDCDPKSIRREARRNGEFRRQLAKAKSEASIHPLHTLRQAAKTNWRAALCWMERLDPERFARPDASIVTQREANQFVADLVESIERTVSDTQDRADLYELLTAAMPVAMRRRWEGQGPRRRRLKQALRDFNDRKHAGVARRCQQRRELFEKIASHLPRELRAELGDYRNVLDPVEMAADRAFQATRRSSASDQHHDDDPTDDRPLDDELLEDCPLDDGPLNDGPSNTLPGRFADPCPSD